MLQAPIVAPHVTTITPHAATAMPEQREREQALEAPPPTWEHASLRDRRRGRGYECMPLSVKGEGEEERCAEKPKSGVIYIYIYI